MIDMKKTYKTRAGVDVRVLCVDAPGSAGPVVALVGSGGISYRYTSEGNLWSCGAPMPLDLIEQPLPVVWYYACGADNVTPQTYGLPTVTACRASTAFLRVAAAGRIMKATQIGNTITVEEVK